MIPPHVLHRIPLNVSKTSIYARARYNASVSEKPSSEKGHRALITRFTADFSVKKFLLMKTVSINAVCLT